MIKRNGPMYPGQLRALSHTSVYKRKATNKLRGFWKTPTQRGVFRELRVCK